MFVTSIIPTEGRETFRRAVYSILDQNFSKDEFELIVVNDLRIPHFLTRTGNILPWSA